MKNMNKIIWATLLIVFVGNFTMNAQDTGALKQEVQKEKTKMDKDKQKMKEQKEAMKDEMKEKKEAMKDEMKEKKEAMKDEMKEKRDAMKDAGDATAFTDLEDERMKELEAKLKLAKTDKERKEIMTMIETLKKGDTDDSSSNDGIIDDEDAVGNNNDKGDPITGNDASTATGNSDVNDYDEEDGKGDVLKGKDYGMAKAEDAKAKVIAKEKGLADKEELVRKGRARIASAKERLAAAIAAGELSEDQIANKQNAIDRAEAGIDRLEASINAGKAAYAKQKAALTDVYKSEN